MKHKIRDFNLEKINADMVLSLGSNCIVAHHLRRNHLRICSSPLDWMINENLEVVYKLFKTDFKDFFIDCSMIEKVEHKANVKDNENEIISIHHFFSNEDLKIQSQRVNHQAVQRWQNIKEKLKNSQNVVLIRSGKANFEELKNFLEQFYSLLLVKQGGGICLINVQNDENLKEDEVEMQELKIDENKRVIQYFIKGILNDFRGDIYFWTKLMKSIKMSKKIKIKNTINEFKIKFLCSCRKRMNFLTKKYKNTIDGTH